MASDFPQSVGLSALDPFSISDPAQEWLQTAEQTDQCIPSDPVPDPTTKRCNNGSARTLFKSNPQELFNSIPSQTRLDLRDIYTDLSPSNRQLLLNILETIKGTRDVQIYDTLSAYLKNEPSRCRSSGSFDDLSDGLILFGQIINEINRRDDPEVKKQLFRLLDVTVEMPNFDLSYLSEYLDFTRYILIFTVKTVQPAVLDAIATFLHTIPWNEAMLKKAGLASDAPKIAAIFNSFRQIISIAVDTADDETMRTVFSTLSNLFETYRYRTADLGVLNSLFNYILQTYPEKRDSCLNMLYILSIHQRLDRKSLEKFRDFVEEMDPDSIWIQRLPPELLELLIEDMIPSYYTHSFGGRTFERFNEILKEPEIQQRFVLLLLSVFASDKRFYYHNEFLANIVNDVLADGDISKAYEFYYLFQIISKDPQNIYSSNNMLIWLMQRDDHSTWAARFGELLKEINSEPDKDLRSDYIETMAFESRSTGLNWLAFDEIKDQFKTCFGFQDVEKRKMCFEALFALVSAKEIDHNVLHDNIQKIYDDIDTILKIKDEEIKHDVFKSFLTLLKNQDYNEYAKKHANFSWSMGMLNVITDYAECTKKHYEFQNIVLALAERGDFPDLSHDTILAFFKALPLVVRSENRQSTILYHFGRFVESGDLSFSTIRLFGLIFTKLPEDGLFDESALAALTALLNNPKFDLALGYKVVHLFGLLNDICKKTEDTSMCWKNYGVLADFLSRNDLDANLLNSVMARIRQDGENKELVNWLPYFETLSAENETNIAYGVRILGQENMFKLMKERNIRFFKRFEPEDLERQMYQIDRNFEPKYLTRSELKDSLKKPVMLIIYNQNDHNGAFYYNDISKLSRSFNVVVYEANDKRQLKDIAKRTAKRYGRPKNLIFGGHGRERGFNLGKRKVEGRDITIKDRKLFKELKEYFDNPTVVMESCSTGKDEEAVGAMIADELDASALFGPVESTSMDEYIIGLDASGEAYIKDVEYYSDKNVFDKNGKIIRN